MAEARRKKKMQELSVVQGSGGKAGFDPVIHERMRLGVLSSLAVNEVLTFTELKELLEASDGNLSVHCRKLEEAKYIKIRKYFEGRTPRTEYRLTASGQRALQAYLDHMEALIQQIRKPEAE